MQCSSTRLNICNRTNCKLELETFSVSMWVFKIGDNPIYRFIHAMNKVSTVGHCIDLLTAIGIYAMVIAEPENELRSIEVRCQTETALPSLLTYPN